MPYDSTLTTGPEIGLRHLYVPESHHASIVLGAHHVGKSRIPFGTIALSVTDMLTTR